MIAKNKSTTESIQLLTWGFEIYFLSSNTVLIADFSNSTLV